jgi:hypothetical protein
MSATDLQKPFSDGELRALLEQYPARPPTMGGSNVSHEDSYLDHYVVSAWEKKCSAILKRREDAAPDLAARVIELEAENKRLREADATSFLAKVLADIRFVTGLGVEPMLSDLAGEVGKLLAAKQAEILRLEDELNQTTEGLSDLIHKVETTILEFEQGDDLIWERFELQAAWDCRAKARAALKGGEI